MKFQIYRTSEGCKPCDGAFPEDYVVVDRVLKATLDGIAPFLLPMYAGYVEKYWEKWCAYGTNHREEGEYWCRDVTATNWFVEVVDLAALIELTKLVDARIIVGAGPTLEIYDDYH